MPVYTANPNNEPCRLIPQVDISPKIVRMTVDLTEVITGSTKRFAANDVVELFPLPPDTGIARLSVKSDAQTSAQLEFGILKGEIGEAPSGTARTLDTEYCQIAATTSAGTVRYTNFDLVRSAAEADKKRAFGIRCGASAADETAKLHLIIELFRENYNVGI